MRDLPLPSVKKINQVETIQPGTVHTLQYDSQKRARRNTVQIRQAMVLIIRPAVSQQTTSQPKNKLVLSQQRVIGLPRQESDPRINMIEHVFDSTPPHRHKQGVRSPYAEALPSGRWPHDMCRYRAGL